MHSWFRFRYPLYLERLKLHLALGKIDFGPLRNRYRGTSRAKYLDFRRYVRRNLYICRELGLLNREPRRRFLDVGCGSGLLLYCAKHYGHDGVGIDIEDPFYAEMAALLGVDRRIEAVVPFQALAAEGPFDVITCIATAFDRYYDERGNHKKHWGADEWRYFLADLEKRLSPGGKIFLWLNRQRIDRDVYDEELGRALRHNKIGHGRRRFLLDRAGLTRALDALSRPTVSASGG
jgi:SAM-dependent methyltransferase